MTMIHWNGLTKDLLVALVPFKYIPQMCTFELVQGKLNERKRKFPFSCFPFHFSHSLDFPQTHDATHLIESLNMSVQLILLPEILSRIARFKIFKFTLKTSTTKEFERLNGFSDPCFRLEIIRCACLVEGENE